MFSELALVAIIICFGAFAYARRGRARLYEKLSGAIARLNPPELGMRLGTVREPPSFADGIVVLEHFLPSRIFAAFKREIQELAPGERSLVPAHKQGGTIAYETLVVRAPTIVSCYQGTELQQFVSRMVGDQVRPTPIHDQSSLSILIYDRPGDHIGWHYDHNFYRGRHFTILLAITNEGRAANGLSHAMLKAQVKGEEIAISTPPNTLVIFEGARIRHKVTPVLQGEKRIMVSMTYCTDSKASWWQGAARRLKDTAFFGIRSLWT
jgi:hypothetical protein